MIASFHDNENNDELWRECANWLTRWEMLRPDHRANWPEASIANLANILRDGVLLCKLLNKIDPNSLDLKDVNLKPTMAQFLCLRNINLFLKTCVTKFGLRECDLFEPLMLFDLTNFHKVLCTLSKLSQSTKASRGPVFGFSAQKVKTSEEEVIYQSLKSVEPTYGPICEQHHEHQNEEIYQDLGLVGVYNRQEQQPTMEKRDFVIKELVDTENNYVDVLQKLMNNFYSKTGDRMNPVDRDIVFYKIPELYKIHSDFSKELSKVRMYDSSVKLSSIFMMWREKFLVYGNYCANLTKAINILQELCDNDERFNQHVETLERKANNGKFKLRDVLSVPMQRILKYHLLLEKLIENTDVNHDEYNDLRRAREAMLDVAAYINEAARDKEHLDVISNLQENIIEWTVGKDINLADYGRLIKDGEIKFKSHDDQKTKSRYVFFFDKCILICKQIKCQQFAFRDIISIGDFHVDEAHNRPLLNKEARWCYNFHLVKNDSVTAFTISVRSIEMKEQMIKAITDALDNIRPLALKRTNHTFELQTFSKPQQCIHCSKFLRGLIFQGYKCTVCNVSVHKTCIASSGKCGAPQSPPVSSSAVATSPPLVPPPLADRFNNSSTMDVDDDGIDRLKCKLWFVGEMDRDTAQKMLERRENGTFLVRIRPRSDDSDKYALSLKTENTVKHMKICSQTDTGEKKFFLSWSKFFSSIEELVINYQVYSLRENFERLGEHTKLEWPFRQIRVVAVRNFQPQDGQQIALREGSRLILVGKEGYREGWWKGKTDLNEVGFFPCQCVREEGEVKFDSAN